MKILSQLLATYLRRWRVQRNQAMTVLMKTINRTQKTANRTGRNSTYWRSDTPPPSRTPRHNIMHEQPGPKRTVITNSPFSALELFLSKEIVKELCKCTNLEERRMATSRRKRWNNVSKEELLTYFGLVLLSGSEKQWDVSTRDWFGKISQTLCTRQPCL